MESGGPFARRHLDTLYTCPACLCIETTRWCAYCRNDLINGPCPINFSSLCVFFIQYRMERNGKRRIVVFNVLKKPAILNGTIIAVY